jgi:hypothetical protein
VRELFWFDAVHLRERAHVRVSRKPTHEIADRAYYRMHSHWKRAVASMSMQVDNRRRISPDPIFNHSGDIRVAASVTMAGMVFVLVAGTALALDLPLKLTPQFPTRAAIAAAPASGPVRVVGTTASPSVACEQQTWPYIDQRCLIRTDAKPGADDSPAMALDSAKLSPIIATAIPAAQQPTQQDATTNSVPQNESAQQPALRERNAINAPDPITMDAGDDAPQQRIVEPARRTRASRHHGFRFGVILRPF